MKDNRNEVVIVKMQRVLRVESGVEKERRKRRALELFLHKVVHGPPSSGVISQLATAVL